RRLHQVAGSVLTQWIANPSLPEGKSGFWAITEAHLDRDYFFSTTHERKSHDDQVNPQTDRRQVRSHARRRPGCCRLGPGDRPPPPRQQRERWVPLATDAGRHRRKSLDLTESTRSGSQSKSWPIIPHYPGQNLKL